MILKTLILPTLQKTMKNRTCVVVFVFRLSPTMYLWISWNLLCRPDLPETHRDPSAFASWGLGFKAWATKPGQKSLKQNYITIKLKEPILKNYLWLWIILQTIKQTLNFYFTHREIVTICTSLGHWASQDTLLDEEFVMSYH